MNLNEIEQTVNTKYFTPIKIPPSQQHNFTSVNEVREFAKGNGNFPVHVQMQRLLQAMFGHHSTCLLLSKNQKFVKSNNLPTMFGNLFKGWVMILYSKNQVLDRRVNDNSYDHLIVDKRKNHDDIYKSGNDDIKRIALANRLAFHADHRTLQEINELISLYCFKIASRFYNIPTNLGKEHVSAYMNLRLQVIETWSQCVDITTLRRIQPDYYFISMDPVTVAMRAFPLDKELYTDQLKTRLRNYKKWHRDAHQSALSEAKETEDDMFIQGVQNQWNGALNTANALYLSAYEQAERLENGDEMNDFIINDSDMEEEEDEDAIREQNRRFDESNLQESVNLIASRYDGTDMYDENASDEQIDEILNRLDKKAKRKERRYARFGDQVEEDEVAEEEDDHDDDEGMEF